MARTQRDWFIGILGLVLAATVSACVPFQSVALKVTLLQRESWDVVTTLVVDRSEMMLYRSQIEEALESAAQAQRAEGLEAHWSVTEAADGSGHYSMTTKGRGYDLLNTTYFGGQALIYNDEGSGYTVFQLNPALVAITAERQTIELNAGRIISTNGSQRDARSVVWVNPTETLEALVIPESAPINWLPLALIACGVSLMAISGGAALASRNRQRQPTLAAHAVPVPPEPTDVAGPAPAAPKPAEPGVPSAPGSAPIAEATSEPSQAPGEPRSPAPPVSLPATTSTQGERLASAALAGAWVAESANRPPTPAAARPGPTDIPGATSTHPGIPELPSEATPSQTVDGAPDAPATAPRSLPDGDTAPPANDDFEDGEATDLRFCDNCGSLLAAEARFCPRCGHRSPS